MTKPRGLEGGREGGREKSLLYSPAPMLQGRERGNDEEGREGGRCNRRKEGGREGGREEGREKFLLTYLYQCCKVESGATIRKGPGTRCFSHREWMKAAVCTVLPRP